MLESWHEFYALLGTAAAALVALLFVAVSIGASVLHPDRAGPTRTFMSPVVFHYAGVLFSSLVALIPTQTPESLGLSMGLLAAIGIGYGTLILVRVIKSDAADMFDDFGYGGIPLAAYCAELAAAWLLWHERPAGMNVLAGALLLLLVVNIRNAWDLTMSLARRSAAEARSSHARLAGAPEAVAAPTQRQSP